MPGNRREYRAVDGGFECECGATRSTPLGMARHRELCRQLRPSVHEQNRNDAESSGQHTTTRGGE